MLYFKSGYEEFISTILEIFEHFYYFLKPNCLFLGGFFIKLSWMFFYFKCSSAIAIDFANLLFDLPSASH
jgi:hypothetical protein